MIDDDYRAEVRAEMKAEALERVDKEMPARYQGIAAPEVTLAWREAMVAGRAGNLIMAGPTGTGKTAAVWSTLRDLIDRGWLFHGYTGGWRYWRATDLAASLRPCPEVEQVIYRARTTPLLIVDDLGSAALSAWQLEQLTRIFDARWENELPAILTTNRPNLRDALDDRLASRIQDGAVILTLRGPDRRRDNSGSTAHVSAIPDDSARNPHG